jgi:hypothetical protein
MKKSKKKIQSLFTRIMKHMKEAPEPTYLTFFNKKTQMLETIKIPQTDEERADLLQKMT